MINNIDVNNYKNKIIYITVLIKNFNDFIEKYNEEFNNFYYALSINFKIKIISILDKLLNKLYFKNIDDLYFIFDFLHNNYINDIISNDLQKLAINYNSIIINKYSNIENSDYKKPDLFINLINQFNIVNKLHPINNIFVNKILSNNDLIININKMLLQDEFLKYILYGLDYYISNVKDIKDIDGLMKFFKLYPNKDIFINNYLKYYKSRIFNNIKLCKISYDYIKKELYLANIIIDVCDIYNLKKDLINFNKEIKYYFDNKNIINNLKVNYNDINNKYSNIDKNIDMTISNFLLFDNNNDINVIFENIPVELQLYCNVGVKYFDTYILTKKISIDILKSSIILQFNNYDIICNLLHASILFSITDNIKLNDIIIKLNVKNNDIFNEHINNLKNNNIISIDENNIVVINNINNDINVFNDINVIKKIDNNKQEINNIESNREAIYDCYIIKILKEFYNIDNKKYIHYDEILSKLKIKLNNILVIDNNDLFEKRLNKLIDNIFIEKNNTDNSYIYIV